MSKRSKDDVTTVNLKRDGVGAKEKFKMPTGILPGRGRMSRDRRERCTIEVVEVQTPLDVVKQIAIAAGMVFVILLAIYGTYCLYSSEVYHLRRAVWEDFECGTAWQITNDNLESCQDREQDLERRLNWFQKNRGGRRGA